MSLDERYPFIRALSDEGRARLAAALTPVRLGARQQYLAEGAPCTSLVLLETGALRVFKLSSAGRQLTLFRVRPGECCLFSLSAVLADAPYPACVEASEPSTGQALPAAVLRALHAREPAVQRLVTVTTHGLLTDLMALVSEVAFRRVDARLAKLLLEETAARPVLETTHEKLAAHLGTAREVVSRLLENFADDGWVRVGRGVVEVVDAAALAATAADR